MSPWQEIPVAEIERRALNGPSCRIEVQANSAIATKERQPILLFMSIDAAFAHTPDRLLAHHVRQMGGRNIEQWCQQDRINQDIAFGISTRIELSLVVLPHDRALATRGIDPGWRVAGRKGFPRCLGHGIPFRLHGGGVNDSVVRPLDRNVNLRSSLFRHHPSPCSSS